MPQYETNTMRVCTKDANGTQYDAAVPAMPKWASGRETFSDKEHCSEYGSDVPWSLDDSNVADSAMFSVGNAPMWSGDVWAAQSTYPDNNHLGELGNANPGLRSTNSWTQACIASPSASAGMAQLVCSRDEDCVPLGSAKMQCLYGVCILDRNATETCYSHRDCVSSNRMCSGNGRCVESVIQVENDLNYAIDFELYAEECSATNENTHPTVRYDMFGASAWETIPDLLEMYGMCSYGNWYEYLEFIDPTNQSMANQGLCGGQSDEKGCLPMASDSTVSR